VKAGTIAVFLSDILPLVLKSSGNNICIKPALAAKLDEGIGDTSISRRRLVQTGFILCRERAICAYTFCFEDLAHLACPNMLNQTQDFAMLQEDSES